MLASRGVDPQQAQSVATQLSRDPEAALRLHVLAELGLNPADKPSPWVAAISSFFTFARRRADPAAALPAGLLVARGGALCGGVGLFVAGALSSRFTPRPWWWAALRQLMFGAAAAGITYLIGTAIGVAVA